MPHEQLPGLAHPGQHGSKALARRDLSPPLPPQEIWGWGRSPRVRARIRQDEKLYQASQGAVLARGLGRAYGDAALPPQKCSRPVLLTTAGDRVLFFDAQSGLIRVEAGISVGELRKIFLDRGFFLPVTPGTRHVTVGGLVAADVHGKNHHVASSFGQHVESMRIRVGDGRILEVNRHDHDTLFAATMGGMGLTGHILEVSFRMEAIPSPWIYEESERCENLAALMQRLAEDSKHWPMTVAWMDTSAQGEGSGRGIVMRGRWADPQEHKVPAHAPRIQSAFALPFEFPSGLINPSTIGWMNRFWYAKHGRRPKSHVVHPESFFWPLDRIGHWNRAFGKRGFTQYQCVIPTDAALIAYPRLLEEFRQRGGCSFVSVFKDCGPEGEGLLSFPCQGTSLALDIPLRGESTIQLVHALNRIVLDFGGRIYLAKDGLTDPHTFADMYPNLPEFLAVRSQYDPQNQIRSHLSHRLMGDTSPEHDLEQSHEQLPPRHRELPSARELQPAGSTLPLP